ncbi:hypothetical protein BJ875DRAFT_159436 [Amylocarpus encephaloides]|uniref:Uncharacterized protein n=1 Tax=Amylocarpus encephaloides TaxID=45428 RepID=A0A9P7YC61_9HELO|nr:hypothetical protein BJ875DRAFT_159436 [Amylocarpus encephaloides]
MLKKSTVSLNCNDWAIKYDTVCVPRFHRLVLLWRFRLAEALFLEKDNTLRFEVPHCSCSASPPKNWFTSLLHNCKCSKNGIAKGGFGHSNPSSSSFLILSSPSTNLIPNHTLYDDPAPSLRGAIHDVLKDPKAPMYSNFSLKRREGVKGVINLWPSSIFSSAGCKQTLISRLSDFNGFSRTCCYFCNVLISSAISTIFRHLLPFTAIFSYISSIYLPFIYNLLTSTKIYLLFIASYSHILTFTTIICSSIYFPTIYMPSCSYLNGRIYGVPGA